MMSPFDYAWQPVRLRVQVIWANSKAVKIRYCDKAEWLPLSFCSIGLNEMHYRNIRMKRFVKIAIPFWLYEEKFGV